MAGRHAAPMEKPQQIPLSAVFCADAPFAQSHHLVPTRVKKDTYVLLCIHCKKTEQELREI